ncbi:MAG: class I SAM-dependent methyltransferase [Chloroflexi bacterium]|nr:class I SAM-dependent methyltransferase [Chloroflexota bacterium]
MDTLNFEPSFTRYLAAKKTVDDRALNRVVWDAFVAALPPQSRAAPVRVIEVGAGIGTMVERLIERGVLTHATYTALDASAEHIAELVRRLRAPQRITVEPLAVELFDWLARAETRTYDALIAHAFLDLLDLTRALPRLLDVLRPGGVFYFTLNFDGATIFEPVIDAVFDTELERLYHETMDARRVNGVASGDSRAGRHVFALLRQAGAEIFQAGSSDWVVFGSTRGYPADEAYFLRFIVHTLDRALGEHPALADRRARFRDWIAQRHAQIETGSLVYIAHQLDFVGRVAGRGSDAPLSTRSI